MLPESLQEEIDEFKSAIDSSWSYSEVEVIGVNELQDYISKEDASFFIMSYSVSDFDGFKTVESVCMELIIIRDLAKKMDSKNLIRYAKIDLVPDCETTIKMFNGWTLQQKKANW